MLLITTCSVLSIIPNGFLFSIYMPIIYLHILTLYTLNVVKTKLLNILYKCPSFGTVSREVRTLEVDRTVLRVQLCLFFQIQDFTQADFEVEDH